MACSSTRGVNGEETTCVTPDVPSSRRSNPRTCDDTASVALLRPEIASKICVVSLLGTRGCAILLSNTLTYNGRMSQCKIFFALSDLYHQRLVIVNGLL